MLDIVSSLCCLFLVTLLVMPVKRLLSNLFSGGNSSVEPSDKKTFRALPSTWYKSEELYELERRAIFSKRWILITHELRFPNSGDWVRFQEAGFQFFLCRDQAGSIKGFHNVCRHRAFPVVTEEKGHSKIFSCQYHGWSYALNGKLAKAPGYNDIQRFNESQNNLLPIHVYIDAKRFIWVNLDAKATPEIAWSDDFAGIDQLPRHEAFNFDDYKYDHSWDMSGDYNWKTLADNYNECYHCATSHPDVSAVADLSVYTVQNKGGNIQHFPGTTRDQERAGLTVVSNYYFPNACMSVT
jgi:phenylpropionate dioxygenase-like ring-hydroxylating dioxygenase large terminal subunit